MQTEKNILDTIKSATPTLSPQARASMWSTIAQTLPMPVSGVAPTPVVSPYSFMVLLRTHTAVVPLIVFLIMSLAGGATAYAASFALPGDTLFPVQRALENAELGLTFSPTAHAALTAQLTAKRMQQLREVITQEVSTLPAAATTSTSTKTGATATSTISGADFGATTTMNRMVISNQGEKRINAAVQAVVSFLDTTSGTDEHRKEVLAQLSTDIKGLTGSTTAQQIDDSVQVGTADGRVHIKMDTHGSSQVDVQQGTTQLHVDEMGGDIHVRTQGYVPSLSAVHTATTSFATSTPVMTISDTTYKHASSTAPQVENIRSRESSEGNHNRFTSDTTARSGDDNRAYTEERSDAIGGAHE